MPATRSSCRCRWSRSTIPTPIPDHIPSRRTGRAGETMADLHRGDEPAARLYRHRQLHGRAVHGGCGSDAAGHARRGPARPALPRRRIVRRSRSRAGCAGSLRFPLPGPTCRSIPMPTAGRPSRSSTKLEQIARRNGLAIGVGPRPSITIVQAIATWANDAEARGIHSSAFPPSSTIPSKGNR